MTAHHHYTIPCGLLLLVIGYLFATISAGTGSTAGELVAYSNYRRAVTIRFLERVVFTMANLCLLAGLFYSPLQGIPI